MGEEQDSNARWVLALGLIVMWPPAPARVLPVTTEFDSNRGPNFGRFHILGETDLSDMDVRRWGSRLRLVRVGGGVHRPNVAQPNCRAQLTQR